MTSSMMPEVGHLAWAPQADIDKVEIFDRYNGVPTLGTFVAGERTHLFWRAAGYTGQTSVWLYVDLTDREIAAIEQWESPDVLAGIVFDSPTPRFVAAAVADDNRVVFEREWNLPAGMTRDGLLHPLLTFVLDCLMLALQEELPATRRQIMQRSSDGVRQLVPC